MTATAALLPLAAATAQLVARGVTEVVKQGTAFADLLRAHDGNTPTARDTATTNADERLELTCDSRALQWKTACQNMTARTNTLHQRLVGKLASQGISLSEPITLRTDADGRMLVANGHPDRADIELLLESDAELAGQLRQLFQQLADLESPSGGLAAPDISAVRLVVSQDGAHFVSQ